MLNSAPQIDKKQYRSVAIFKTISSFVVQYILTNPLYVLCILAYIFMTAFLSFFVNDQLKQALSFTLF